MYMTFKIKYHILRYTRHTFPSQITLWIWSNLSSVRWHPHSSHSIFFMHLRPRRCWVILWNALEREILSYTSVDAIQFLHAEAQKYIGTVTRISAMYNSTQKYIYVNVWFSIGPKHSLFTTSWELILRRCVAVVLWIKKITVNPVKHNNCFFQCQFNMFRPGRSSTDWPRIIEILHCYIDTEIWIST